MTHQQEARYAVSASALRTLIARHVKSIEFYTGTDDFRKVWEALPKPLQKDYTDFIELLLRAIENGTLPLTHLKP